MITGDGPCGMQDRPVGAISGIHAPIPTDGGPCGMQDRPVGATSGIHASVWAGQQYMILNLRVSDYSGTRDMSEPILA